MATRPGNVLNTVADFADSAERHDIQHNATFIITGAPEAIYEMQAVDSVTLALFRWLSPTPAYDGTGYPGPNAPTETAIRELKVAC